MALGLVELARLELVVGLDRLEPLVVVGMVGLVDLQLGPHPLVVVGSHGLLALVWLGLDPLVVVGMVVLGLLVGLVGVVPGGRPLVVLVELDVLDLGLVDLALVGMVEMVGLVVALVGLVVLMP